MRSKLITGQWADYTCFKAASYSFLLTRYETKHKSEKTCFKAGSYSVQLTRYQTQINTSTDHSMHISKQKVSVSSQQGIVPRLITSEGTKLPKVAMHQITKQSSARSEMCLKSLQSKCKQKPSLPLMFSTLKVHLIC